MLEWVILSVVVLNLVATTKLLKDNKSAKKTVDKPRVKVPMPRPSPDEVAVIHRLIRTLEKENAERNNGPTPHTDLM